MHDSPDDQAALDWLDQLGEADGEPTAATLRFSNPFQWVEQWFAETIRRRMGPTTLWCPHWWQHPEARQRLFALWSAWEAAEAEGGASPSIWWISHFDSHWRELTASDGPFASCAGSHRDALPPLKTVPYPEDKP